MESLCPDVTADSPTSVWNVSQSAKGVASGAQKRKRLFVYKGQKKYLIPLYIRVFRDFIYIIYLLQRLF